MNNKSSLSVVINTKNSAETLARAIKSVHFADQVVVVDMKSTDDTVKIAKRLGAQVYSFKDVGYVEPARNFAIGKADSDWILVLDSDEQIPNGLKTRITQILKTDASGKLTASAFYIPRRNNFFGNWLTATGFWPDFQLRLFRKNAVEWSDEIHSIPVTQGEVLELPVKPEAAIWHYNYPTVSSYLQRMDRYTTIEAETKDASQKITGVSLLRSFRQDLIGRLMANQGYLDGSLGVGLSLIQPIYQVLTLLKIEENKQHSMMKKVDPAQFDNELKQWQQELAYWRADINMKQTSGLKRFVWQIRRKFRI